MPGKSSIGYIVLRLSVSVVDGGCMVIHMDLDNWLIIHHMHTLIKRDKLFIFFCFDLGRHLQRNECEEKKHDICGQI